MLNEKQKKLLSMIPRKPTSEIKNRYDDIIALQKKGYKLKDILDVYIKTDVFPANFAVKRFYTILQREKVRRQKHNELFAEMTVIEPEKDDPIIVSPPAVQDEKDGIASPTHKLTDEEKAKRRAEKLRQQQEERAKRRATQKAKEKKENPQPVTIDHATKTFKING
jgi:hypothetical protein